jgi:hypothetical protein
MNNDKYLKATMQRRRAYGKAYYSRVEDIAKQNMSVELKRKRSEIIVTNGLKSGSCLLLSDGRQEKVKFFLQMV